MQAQVLESVANDGHAPIDPSRSLLSQGVGQPMIEQLLIQVEQEFAVHVPLREFLLDPTLQRLSAQVERNIQTTLEVVPEVADVLRTARQSLGDVPLDDDADLFQQGVNSLAILRLLQDLRRRHGLDIAVDTFLKKPTLSRLAELACGAPTSSTTPQLPHVVPSTPARVSARPAARVAVEDVLAMVHDAMGSDGATADADLFLEGMNSLALLKLVQRVRQRWGVDVAIDALLKSPTAARLATLAGAHAPSAVDSPAGPLADASAAAESFGSGLGILSTKAEKDAFLRLQLNLRPDRQDDEAIGARRPFDRDSRHDPARFRSRREFENGAVPLDNLLAWLAHLGADLHEGKYRYPYPSAGGTYSVQVYLEAKPDAVAGLAEGIYYHHPHRRVLIKVSDALPGSAAHFFYNRPVHEACGFCLYFVAELRAIAPLYKEQTDHFVAVEAGAMIQRLIEHQARHAIGSCVLSGVDPASVQAPLALDPERRVLLAMACGTVMHAQDGRDVVPAPAPAAWTDIAIVGLDGRFPGARDLDAFWDNLRAGRVSISAPPLDRWQAPKHAHDYGGYLDGTNDVDTDRFGLREEEALALDPQERQLLASTHRLLEASGYGGAKLGDLSRRVGVFLGVMWSGAQLAPDGSGSKAAHAPFSILPNRLSHHFDWTGPSMAVDTSCSSALTAIYLACDSIRRGDCKVAVAGGINLFAHAGHLENLRQLRLIADHDRSQTFGDEAAGWLPGEGLGTVLLVPLAEARARGDAIWGVIRGGGIGHAGQAPRFGMPSVEQQAALMRDTLQRAGVSPGQVQYIEAAAAGSAMGDAAEMQALKQVFGVRADALTVGSVKPNVGHLESASGMTQLAKVLLQMRHEEIVPVVPVARRSPLIQLDGSALHIADSITPWPLTTGRSRLALINGLGGTGSYTNLLIESGDPIETPLPGTARTALVAQTASDSAEPVARIDDAPSSATSPQRHAEIFLIQALTLQLHRPIDVGHCDASLFDLGVTSVNLVRLVHAIESTIGARVESHVFFDNPSIASLSAHLSSCHAEAFRQSLPAPTVATVATSADRSADDPSQDSPYALSESQKGLWALQRLNPESSAYNCPVCLRAISPLDASVVPEVLARVVARHPLLATVIEEHDDGEPMQRIDRAMRVPLTIEDLSALDAAAALEHIGEVARQPFAMMGRPLLRAHVFHTGSGVSHVMLVIHHLVFDGRSFAPLVTTFADALRDAREVHPTGEATGSYSSFPAYVRAERQLLESPEGERRLAHWRAQLQDSPPSLLLPTEGIRVARTDFAGASRRFDMSPALGSQVRELSKSKGVYPSNLFFAVFKTLLWRYTAQDSLIVGIPFDARRHDSLRSATEVGYFVDMLPVRSELDHQASFIAFAQGLQSRVLEGMANAYPLPALVRALKIRPEAGVSPIFQVAFAYQDFADSVSTSDALSSLEYVDEIAQEGEYEMLLEVAERGGEFTLKWKFDPQLHSVAAIDRMAGHFLSLLRGAIEAPGCSLGKLPLLGDEERHTLLSDWQGTHVPRAPGDTVHGSVERQALATPDAVAVACGGQSLTYRALDAQANRLACELVRRGVQPGTFVGVCMDRSVELVVGLLAILKAGGAYVPLDPEYPVERLRYMLGDVAAPVVLGQARHQPLLDNLRAHALYLDDGWHERLPQPPAADAPAPACRGDDIAYVIFTSGSTGKPKGCMLPHSAVCNRLSWMQEAYPLDERDRVLQKTPYSFDVSVWEFFWPLRTGASLVLAMPGGHKDPAYLVDLIERERITTCHFVPSMLAVFVNELKPGRCVGLRQVFASGEALPQGLTRDFARLLPAKLHNLYGPTEAAVDVSFWECQVRADGRVPIGRPISNVALHVLDRQMQLLPIGVPGELHIGGMCLARGYLNQDALTRQKFIADPFSGQADARLYKTGDLARWLPDGTIDYLGRIDHQVKLRGFRIELGEIEAVLARQPQVREVAVLMRDDAVGDKRLVAYLACHPGIQPTTAELRRFLQNEVPDYMVPSSFITLETLPLTQSGKLDRQALPDAVAPAAMQATFVAPRNAQEIAIAGLWTRLLGLDQVGIHDNFFDIGGHSLKAVTLIARLSSELGLTGVTPLGFYQAPTIDGIVQLVSRDDPSRHELVPLLRRGTAETQLTIVCSPYAGASVTVFQSFADALCLADPHLAVRGISIPGNELGGAPASFESFEQLASMCVDELLATVDGPIALYGHCVGSFLALEVVRRLELRGRPVRFFASGATFPFPRLVRFLPINDPWRFSSDAKIQRLIQSWGGSLEDKDDQVTAFLIANFRKDARHAFQYEQRRKRWKISAPIVNIVSRDDPLTRNHEKRHRAWQALSDDVRLAVIPEGGHYFVAGKASEIARIVCDFIRQSTPRDGQDAGRTR